MAVHVGSEPFDHLLKAYARLVVRLGVNVQFGQRVVINSEVEHAPVARALAEAAYLAGASFVSIDYRDQELLLAQVRSGPDESLGRVLPHELQGIAAWRRDRPAVIFLTGNPHPGLMNGVDPARVMMAQPISRTREVAAATSVNTVPWTVVAAPNPGWADFVFGSSDLTALWQAVAVAMRLDEPDPVQSWRQHLATLATRRDMLNLRRFDRVRFSGPGTDLTVGLAAKSRWITAGMTSMDGTEFVANMPTEEVYVSPDWRRSDGVARTTAAFYLMGNVLVEGLTLKFSDGALVEATADRGEEAVRHQLGNVPRARHLGEVAIVDGTSRVRRTNLTFGDMLYDENVASHIAWGNGYPTAFEGAVPLSREERIEAGLNQSSVHVDVVIGGPVVEIDGLSADSTTTPLLRGNTFVLTEA